MRLILLAVGIGHASKIARRQLSARMKLMRQATLVMLLLVMRTGVAMAGETQIVLQWLDTAESVMDLREIYKIEDALEAVSGGRYSVDGHDVGSGKVNVFLYAEDSKVDLAISTIVGFFDKASYPKACGLAERSTRTKNVRTGTSNLSTHQDWLSSISCIRRELHQVSEGRLASSLTLTRDAHSTHRKLFSSTH
jgi:hypothetical protein